MYNVFPKKNITLAIYIHFSSVYCVYNFTQYWLHEKDTKSTVWPKYLHIARIEFAYPNSNLCYRKCEGERNGIHYIK